ncbi:MAG: reverse gyrase [Hydrogenothermaceae bacterium]
MLFYIKSGCPNCKGLISDDRLSRGLPCEVCLPEENITNFEDVCANLKSDNNLKLLDKFCQTLEKVEYFSKLFEKVVKNKPSSLQINWAKRFYLGESFAIVSPTGTGKSSFGLLLSLIVSGKVLIVLPTKLLVQQFYQKLKDFSKVVKSEGIKREIVAYRGKEAEKRAFENGEFDIFICTIAFMHKNFEKLKQFNFSFIFVDDVDSFLKSGKNVEHLFNMLGFSEEDIKFALRRDNSPQYYEKLSVLREKIKTQLIVSSATLKPKTNRAILFQNLLGFEIARFVSTLRNVEDMYIESEIDFEVMMDKAVEIVKHLKEGGIIFINDTLGREYVEKATDILKKRKIKVASYLDLKESELLNKLKNRKVDVVVGLAHLSNPLLRGIDLPDILRYVIFVGVPKSKFRIDQIQPLPSVLHNLLLSLMPLFDEDEKVQAIADVNYLKKYLTIKEDKLREYEVVYQKVLKIKEFLEGKLNNGEFRDKLKESEEVFLELQEDGSLYVVVGNPQVYLQGSGRVSRLTSKGLLPGLSIIISDSQKALNSLKKRLRYYVAEDIQIKKVDLDYIIQADKRVRQERESLERGFIDFKTKLVIVESPHKAKTIASFFGKPSMRKVKNVIVYEIPTENTLLSITASLGHIFNLSRKEGIYGVIEKEDNFYPVFDSIKIDRTTNKQYVDEEIKNKENIFDKGQIVEALRILSFYSDEVLVASDPDAEGEKIAYDLFINLRPFRLDIKRLEFHEITKQAFKESISSPRSVDINRVKAQLSRRVADRWVGFSLSEKLWAKFKRTGLSAGRVQTPVLGWVIDMTKESKVYKFRILFTSIGHRFSFDIEDKYIAQKVFEHLDRVNVETVKEEVIELSPPPPYTTDTVLEDAFNFYRFNSDYTMELLQELFESGLITYHRTDSTRVSEVGRFQVAKPYIVERLGEEYLYPREFYSEGAHECIRPTKPWDLEDVKLRVSYGLLSFNSNNIKEIYKLYSLIFNRFMASQTRKVKVLKTSYRLSVNSYSYEEDFISEIIEDGFNILYGKIEPLKLPPELKVEDKQLMKIPKVSPFTQASLIQQMKQKKLGRPSTYAEIVSTLLHRNYIFQLKNGYLISTKLGEEVYSYLIDKFEDYVSEEFTRELEEFMDKVESGEKDYREIFLKLLPLVKDVEKKIT